MVSFFTYNNNIPAANNNPSVDQPNMLTNTNSIDSIINVDHYSFETNFDGTHKQVQLKEVAGGDGTIPVGLQGTGFETLYSSVVTTPNTGEIFFVRGAEATGIQLTGPGNPVRAGNGFTFLPGGLRMQWGSLAFTGTGPHETGLQLFTTPFTNTCYNVSLTLQPNASGQTDNSTLIAAILVDKFRFRWVWNGVAVARYPNAFWTAIGD